jgi:hypothetical protein
LKWGKQDKKRKKENQSSSSDSSTCNNSTAVSSVLCEVNGVLHGSPLTDSTPVTPVIGNVQDSVTSTSTPIASHHQHAVDKPNGRTLKHNKLFLHIARKNPNTLYDLRKSQCDGMLTLNQM